MALMRQRGVHCGKCQASGRVVANLETGQIESVFTPPECECPDQCAAKFSAGIFARPFEGWPGVNGYEGDSHEEEMDRGRH
jgi:hypothetical protein